MSTHTHGCQRTKPVWKGILAISTTSRSRPIRILHVFYQLARGGAETRTLELMRCMDRQRFQFHFLAASGRAATLDDEVRRLGGEIHYQKMGIAFGRAFRRLIRRERVDAVHCHMTLAAGWIVRLAALEGVPKRIVHFRSNRPPEEQHFVRSLLQACMGRWVNRYATDILAVGEATMSSMWPDWRSDPRCRVVYNGLDVRPLPMLIDPGEVREEFRLPRDSQLYIHVGNYTLPKNHLRLLAIFAAVHRENPATRLLLAGANRGGGIMDRVRAQIAVLGLSDSVVMAGERTDVPRLLRAADVMVFPSVREGLPGAVLEACAQGTPVLASDLPSIREIQRFFPEVRCMSLARGDADWAASAGALADAADQTAALRRSAFDRFAATPFTMQRCLDALSRVWDDVPDAIRGNPSCARDAVPIAAR